MLPTLVAIPVSLTPERYLSLPKGGISFEHYAEFFGDPSWRGSLGQSLAIGLAVTLLATGIGTLAAVALWRLSSWLAEGVRLLALAPMIVPPIVSALAFYRAWAGLGLLDTFTGVTVAHTLLALPYVLITVSAALATIDLRQEQASRSLGASLWQTIRWVILPQIMPGVATGAVFAFIVSWDEIVVTLFIAVARGLHAAAQDVGRHQRAGRPDDRGGRHGAVPRHPRRDRLADRAAGPAQRLGGTCGSLRGAWPD